MGLFQKNPFSTNTGKSLYTLGLSKTVLIAGLGNIGEDYQKTRHNAGFMAVDAFATAHELKWVLKKDLRAHLAIGTIGDTKVIVCKPTTMMNLSGKALLAVTDFYKIETSHMVVVYDELDLDFGQIRCRVGGSAAGHNGIKSIIGDTNAEFGRVRIGVGPKKPAEIEQSRFVLGKFTKEQQTHLEDMGKEATAILTEYVSAGELPHDTRSFIA